MLRCNVSVLLASITGGLVCPSICVTYRFLTQEQKKRVWCGNIPQAAVAIVPVFSPKGQWSRSRSL